MLRGGAAAEARALAARGLAPADPLLRAIGMPHLFALAAGGLTEPEALERMRRDTRQYAKRQMTWLRSQPGVRWIEAADPAAAAREFTAMARAFIQAG